MQRFEALDSWRGIAASMVVVFHLNLIMVWSLHGAPALDRFTLFVDFFFVLSGFVMAATYERRLNDGFGIGPFMVLRFARLYPLHLATLAAAIAIAVGAKLFPLSEFNPRAVFDGGLYDFTAIFTNLTLVHGFAENHFTWNYPSWSISAEFYTYLVFALIWAFGGPAARWAPLALAVGGALLASAVPQATPSPTTLLDCIRGFAAGVVVQHIVRALDGKPNLLDDKRLAIAAELGAVALCVVFIANTLPSFTPWIGPFAFPLAILVFAFERGPVSALLRTRPFLALGTLSYSIYMVHAVLIMLLWPAISGAARALGFSFADTPADNLTQTPLWAGDLVMLAFLAAVIAVSAATYAYIETPGRNWGKSAAQAWRRRTAPASGPAPPATR